MYLLVAWSASRGACPPGGDTPITEFSAYAASESLTRFLVDEAGLVRTAATPRGRALYAFEAFLGEDGILRVGHGPYPVAGWVDERFCAEAAASDPSVLACLPARLKTEAVLEAALEATRGEAAAVVEALSDLKI